MSDYSDAYYKLNEDNINKEFKANKYKERLLTELTTETMIKIMFADYLDKLGCNNIIFIGEKLLVN